MDLISYATIFSLIAFILGLIAILEIISIIKRTKDKIKTSFIIICIGMVFFITLEILKSINIISATYTEIFAILFIIFLTYGLWNLKSLIISLSDFGQAFVPTSVDKHEDNLISLLKNTDNVCYVSLNKSLNNLVGLFDLYGIDTSSMHFINASGKQINVENCINIDNNPEVIKQSISRVLKEKNLNCVIFDDVSELDNIEKFNIPLFVQEAASLIKSNEAQGFFMGNIEKLGNQTINDISMLVDKVIRSDE